MTSEQSAMNIIGRALWDPTPTVTDLRARQLAFVLGYPDGWRVVRTIEEVPVPEQKTLRPNKIDVAENKDEKTDQAISAVSELIPEKLDTKNEDEPQSKSVTDKEETNPEKLKIVSDPEAFSEAEVQTVDTKNEGDKEIQVKVSEPEIEHGDTKNEVDKKPRLDTSEPEVQSEIIKTEVDNETKPETGIDQSSAKEVALSGRKIEMIKKKCIVDRIYAGDPETGCDMWFNHETAMQVAETWTEESTPFDHKGGHMLPRQPLFEKGNKVQVFYNDEWFDAKILKRKDSPGGFLYQVYYSSDSTKQSKVKESTIRHRPAQKDPELTATEIGFESGWKAYATGNNKFKVIAPDGTVYKSKKAAMDACKAAARKAVEDGDPPWRTTGSDYLGRKILFTHEYKASARRTVQIDQVGEVTGWIRETDVDKSGQPGFVSDTTGKPARLYHVKFKDEPRHPYANYLLSEQDFEEFELVECLVPEEEDGDTKSRKKSRKS